jgi:type II secretory pathway pseudopilin PulG
MRVNRGGADRRRDAGTTLAELMVSTLVFTIILIVAGTALTMTIRTSRGTTERSNNLSGAQLAVDSMSKLIQTAAQPPAVVGGTPASAIITATANDLKFYGYYNPGAGPAKIEFSVISGNLVETVTPSTNSGANVCTPPFSYGATPTISRTLATGVGTSPTIFTYATQPATPVVSGSPMALSGTPASLTSTQLGQVELVTITLSVNNSGTSPTGDANPPVSATGAQTTVSLPNHYVASTSIPGSAC